MLHDNAFIGAQKAGPEGGSEDHSGSRYPHALCLLAMHPALAVVILSQQLCRPQLLSALLAVDA